MSEFISISSAQSLVSAYQEGISSSETAAVDLDKDQVQELIDQDGASGVRVYFAKNSSSATTVVLTAIDSDNYDLDEGLCLNFGRHRGDIDDHLGL